MYRTECTMYDEVSVGNPGKVPYCTEQDKIEPDCTNCERPNVTKADKIRSMSDEELAGWLERIRLCCSTDLCGRNCPFAEVCYSSAEAPKETLDWLRQEA